MSSATPESQLANRMLNQFLLCEGLRGEYMKLCSLVTAQAKLIKKSFVLHYTEPREAQEEKISKFVPTI